MKPVVTSNLPLSKIRNAMMKEGMAPTSELDAGAMAHFARIAPEVPSDLRASPTTCALLTELARALSEVDACSALLARDGLMIDGKHGRARHPAVTMRGDAQRRVSLFISKLRLGAAAMDARDVSRRVQREAEISGFMKTHADGDGLLAMPARN